MNIQELRALAGREETDYLFLLDALKNYRQPRNKIQSFLRSKDLIRVKKGLYVFGENVRIELYSKELLANLIYGPSAISLEYALSYYGLIPERVNIITSIANNRNKIFKTPVGNFEYFFISGKKYSTGITQIRISHDKHFLIASREKALADMLCIRMDPLDSEKDLLIYLIENLRMDESDLKQFDYKTVSIIAHSYKNKNVFLLQRLLEKNNE